MSNGIIPSPTASIPVTSPGAAPGTPTSTPPTAGTSAPQQPQAPTAPKATLPTGSITGDTDKFIETQILAAIAAQAACEKLARKLRGHEPEIKTLIINNGIDRTAIANYKAFIVLLSGIRFAYDQMISEAKTALDLSTSPLSSLAAVTSVESFAALSGILPVLGLPGLIAPTITSSIKSIADVINMFRTDTAFRNAQVIITEQVVVTLLVPYLLPQGTADEKEKHQCKIRAIYYPSLYPLDVESDSKGSQLQELITQVLNSQAQGDGTNASLKQAITDLTIQQQTLDAQVNSLLTQVNSATDEASKFPLQEQMKSKLNARLPISDKLVRLRQCAANLDALKANTVSFVMLLTNVDTSSQLTLLAPLVRVERLQTLLSQEGTFVLDLSVTASGTTRIRSGLFFNAKVSHSGGVSISARLFDRDAKLVFGEVVNHYIDYKDPQQIREMLISKYQPGAGV